MSAASTPWNFLGLAEELTSRSRARAWVLPVPYDATVSYGAGTRNGPAAIISASLAVELFDLQAGCEPACEWGVHTLPPLEVDSRGPDRMVEKVRRVASDLLASMPAGGVLATLGGEHSISVGLVRAAAEFLERTGSPSDLVVVQVDAHADLRDSYQGSPMSHACAARRMLEVSPVFQIGIRNVSAEGARLQQSDPHVTTVSADRALEDPDGLQRRLAEFVRGRHVYLTIDLDGLDPSIMPSVGTPEPGGLGWSEVTRIARTVTREARRVLAFDVVELAPVPGLIAPDFLAAKLVHVIMCLALAGSGA